MTDFATAAKKFHRVAPLVAVRDCPPLANPTPVLDPDLIPVGDDKEMPVKEFWPESRHLTAAQQAKQKENAELAKKEKKFVVKGKEYPDKGKDAEPVKVERKGSYQGVPQYGITGSSETTPSKETAEKWARLENGARKSKDDDPAEEHRKEVNRRDKKTNTPILGVLHPQGEEYKKRKEKEGKDETDPDLIPEQEDDWSPEAREKAAEARKSGSGSESEERRKQRHASAVSHENRNNEEQEKINYWKNFVKKQQKANNKAKAAK